MDAARCADIPMKHLLPFVLLGAALSVSASGAGETAPLPTLYERIEAKLSTRKDLANLEQPPAELKQVEWMLGDWTVASTVFATRSAPERQSQGSSVISRTLNHCWVQNVDSYPDGWQDISYLTFNPVTRRWVTLAIDASGNAVQVTSGGWQDDRLVFEATVEIVGEPCHLRQTMRKVNVDEFHILNEERLSDGRWVGLDEYRYRRRQ